MSFSLDGFNWTVWEAYDTTRTIELLPHEGEQRVCFRTRDLLGNTANGVCDTIILDTTRPEEYDIKINDDDESAEEETKPELSVELYVTSICQYCQKARVFFQSRGIKFIEYNIDEDRKAAERLSSLTESDSFPFAVINGHHIKGYSASDYVRALRK